MWINYFKRKYQMKIEEIKKYTFPFKQRLIPIYFIIL